MFNHLPRHLYLLACFATAALLCGAAIAWSQSNFSPFDVSQLEISQVRHSSQYDNRGNQKITFEGLVTNRSEDSLFDPNEIEIKIDILSIFGLPIASASQGLVSMQSGDVFGAFGPGSEIPFSISLTLKAADLARFEIRLQAANPE